MKNKIYITCFVTAMIIFHSQLASTAGSGAGDSASGWETEVGMVCDISGAMDSFYSNRMVAGISGVSPCWVVNLPVIFLVGLFMFLIFVAGRLERGELVQSKARIGAGVSGVNAMHNGLSPVEKRRGNIFGVTSEHGGVQRWRSHRSYDYFHYYRG